MAHPVADIFLQAAVANSSDARRSGNVVALEAGCDLIVCGDIHGNRAGLTKIISRAGLAEDPNRRLIIQEVIHGQLDPVSQLDRSIELLMRVARLKISNPLQVLFVLGNHDVAQVTGNEITKEGLGVCKTFSESLQAEFKESADEIAQAVNEFLLSMPLAVRCPNGVFVAHSLPAPARMALAGVEILDRIGPYRMEDLKRGGSVYEWTWGRGQTSEQLSQLADRLQADYFILGHRHAPEGFEVISPLGITISSDNQRGHVIRLTTDQPFDDAIMKQSLTPIIAM
jgi:hypothetical protein